MGTFDLSVHGSLLVYLHNHSKTEVVVIPFTLPQKMIEQLKEAQFPVCPKCHSNSHVYFTDHGHLVGKGYYCRSCKDDVPHPHNEYGSMGKQVQARKAFGALPKANTGTWAVGNTKFQTMQLDCPMPHCVVCRGRFTGMPTINLKPGDLLRCDIGLTRIKVGGMYEVAEVLARTIRVWCMDPKTGTRMAREYTRCRFSKLTPVP